MSECTDCDYVYWNDEWKKCCEYLEDGGRCPFETTPGEE